MTLSSGTTTVIKTPLKRPKVSFSLDREMTDKDKDPLPIVELKPFVHKVWRREKSLPSFYDRPSSINATTGGSSGRQSEVLDSVSEIDVEEASSPPPRTAYSLPIHLPSQRSAKFEKAFQDFQSQKEHFNRFVIENGFKPKQRIHPQVESINRKQPVHTISLIPGSFTRDDREKTTVVEITYGDSFSRSYSCSPKAISPVDVKKQQLIQIKGEPVVKGDKKTDDASSSNRSFIGSWHSTGLRHGSPASMLFHSKQTRNNGTKRPKTPLYDLLDRKGTLPSLQINSKSLRKRHSRNFDPAVSEDYQDYRDAYETNLRTKVGGIENSLKILNQYGAPTKVERQITFELEQNLSRLRKTKDYSPFEVNPTEIAKFYSPPNFNLTQGEASIRLGLHSNASRRNALKSRSTLRNGIPPGVSRSNDNQFARNLFRKTFGRLDDLPPENSQTPNGFRGYNISDRAQTNMTFTTDDELRVPNDTPRSRIESQMSLVKHQVSIADSNDNILKDAGTLTEKRHGKENIVCDPVDKDNGYSSGHSNTQTEGGAEDMKRDQPQTDEDIDQYQNKPLPADNKNGFTTTQNETTQNISESEEPLLCDAENGQVPNGNKIHDDNQMHGTVALEDKDASGRTFITSDSIALPPTGAD